LRLGFEEIDFPAKSCCNGFRLGFEKIYFPAQSPHFINANTENYKNKVKITALPNWASFAIIKITPQEIHNPGVYKAAFRYWLGALLCIMKMAEKTTTQPPKKRPQKWELQQQPLLAGGIQTLRTGKSPAHYVRENAAFEKETEGFASCGRMWTDISNSPHTDAVLDSVSTRLRKNP
jgi:hypothetical protein